MNIGEKQNKTIFPSNVYNLRAEEFNQIVSELQHIIDTAGITKSASNTTQLLQALQALFSIFTSSQITDTNSENTKTQAQRNREYEAALAGGVTLAYPKGYIYGGLLTYNSTSIVNIAASACRSSDDTKNIFVSASSLNITTASNWASGSVPALLASLKIYIWAVYGETSTYKFDDSTGSNITGQKQLIAKLKTNASSKIILQTLVDFSLDVNSANTRMAPDIFSGTTKDYAGFTATENGWIYCEGYSNPGWVRLYVNGEFFTIIDGGSGPTYASKEFKISKGDICSLGNSAGAVMTKFIFYPCKGNI